jgi:cytochrome c oxidase subunit 2
VTDVESQLQSVLHPAPGSGAALLHELGLALYVGGALIFIAVTALVLHATFGRARKIDARALILGGGVAFPVFTLSLLFSYALAVGGALTDVKSSGPLQLLLDCFSSLAPQRLPPGDTAPRIHVVGKQWWWEVRYEPQGEPAIVLANELRIPTGAHVEVELTTTDVIHSFWAPTLAGKVDMIPGRRTRLTLRADAPGVHRGQCAEYCGGQHALMAFYVVAERPEDFRRWLAREAQPAAAPTDAFLQLGRDAFFRGDCHECHTVRGTPAAGQDGPDLTHVGSRRSLGAGALRNHAGAMAGWIADPHGVKDGVRMPASDAYTGRELRALAAWLASLE